MSLWRERAYSQEGGRTRPRSRDTAGKVNGETANSVELIVSSEVARQAWAGQKEGRAQRFRSSDGETTRINCKGEQSNDLRTIYMAL